MEILLTNDDGYQAKGLRTLAGMMKAFGNVTVLAPKHHQSGMSMAVSMNHKALAYKKLGTIDGVDWNYFDASPASCVKFALNPVWKGPAPDVIISGINHGSNAASASCYSGTLGAVAEAALNGILGIGVSLDTSDPEADFSQVEKYFPEIFSKLMASKTADYGVYYNINFPKTHIPIKGIRVASQGMGKWVREYVDWSPGKLSAMGIKAEQVSRAIEEAEEGESLYIMAGEFTDDPRNPDDADHRFNDYGYITIVPHNIDCTDYSECRRLRSLGIDKEIQTM